MNKTTNIAPKLQVNFVNNQSKQKLTRVTFEFTALPKGVLKRVKSHLHAVYQALVESARMGIWDPAVRWLAWYTGKGERQVKRDLKELCGLGLIVRIIRRLTANRNQTNLYQIPAMGVGVMDDTEKKGECLKTNTPALAPAAGKSDRQLLHELRRAKDEADSLWMHAKYEAKSWRIKAMAKVKTTLNATLGMDRETPGPTMDDVTLAQLRKKHGAITLSLES